MVKIKWKIKTSVEGLREMDNNQSTNQTYSVYTV